MTRTDLWKLVNEEAGKVIKGIEEGKFKDRRGYRDYIGMVYNWNMTDAIVSIVDVYIQVKGLEIPWDETEEPTE